MRAAALARQPIRSTAIAFVAGLLGLLTAPGAQAATFTVGSTGDGRDVSPGNGLCDTTKRTGLVCTLRAAIQEANALGGADAIGFEIGGSRVVKTISPATALPQITKPVTIDGYTQPGASANTQTTGDNATLLVELNGSRVSASGSGSKGLAISSGQSLVQGLVINDFLVGIELRDRGGNKLLGNFIGTDPTGTVGEGNGTNIFLTESSSNLIGGTAPAARNIVSDSTHVGISLGASSANKIQGNYIGTDRSGTADLGNGTDFIHFGAILLGGTSTANRIGGSDAGAANVIAYSGGMGVSVFGDESIGNRILSNSIHHNGYMGINIAGEGITANDQGDGDVGGNQRQNHPVISDAERVGFSGTVIKGSLNSAASTTYTLQFFSNPADETIDEGQHYLGQTTVTTGPAGGISFRASLNTGNLTGAFVTATATDPAGNTSEFSPGRVVDPPPIEG